MASGWCMCGPLTTPATEAVGIGSRTEPSLGRPMTCVWVEFTSGGVIVGDTRAPGADYYRQTAEEIRQFARRSRFPEISTELFEIADRFDRMAAFVEGREVGHPIGRPKRNPPGRPRPALSRAFTQAFRVPFSRPRRASQPDGRMIYLVDNIRVIRGWKRGIEASPSIITRGLDPGFR
jgi:hypothetical protein